MLTVALQTDIATGLKVEEACYAQVDIVYDYDEI